jgi:SAM-dependent methyltransferase
VAFNVTPEAYTRFMGRYSLPLAVKFLDVLDPKRGQRALDVGCGTGIVTAELAERLGQEAVAAIDPSPPFLSAVRLRLPYVDLREGHAEELPFDDDTFDLALAQLAVHFMADPVKGVAEMARVVRPGGVVAAAVWDIHGGGSPLSMFWRAAHAFDPHAMASSGLPGVDDADLDRIFHAAGLTPYEPVALSVHRWFESFEEWWEPYLLGVGPAGDFVTGLDEDTRVQLAAQCRNLLPAPPFDVPGKAWCVRAVV